MIDTQALADGEWVTYIQTDIHPACPVCGSGKTGWNCEGCDYEWPVK